MASPDAGRGTCSVPVAGEGHGTTVPKRPRPQGRRSWTRKSSASTALTRADLPPTATRQSSCSHMLTQRRSSHGASGRLGSVKFTFPARNLKLRRRQQSTITGPGIFPPPGKKRCRPCQNAPRDAAKSSVRLLESGAGTGTAELLGLGSSGVGDEESTVEVDEGSLQLVLGVLVDVLAVVGNLQENTQSVHLALPTRGFLMACVSSCRPSLAGSPATAQG